MDKKAIENSIRIIAGKTADIRKAVQLTLTEIGCHVVQHGEVSLYGKLLDALEGVNRVGVHRWIAQYGFAVFKDGEWKLNKTALKEFRRGGKTDLEFKVAANDYRTAVVPTLPNWWEDSTESKRIEKVWDAVERAESLIKACAAHVSDGKNTDLERYLREAVAKYRAELIAPQP